MDLEFAKPIYKQNDMNLLPAKQVLNYGFIFMNPSNWIVQQCQSKCYISTNVDKQCYKGLTGNGCSFLFQNSFQVDSMKIVRAEKIRTIMIVLVSERNWQGDISNSENKTKKPWTFCQTIFSVYQININKKYCVLRGIQLLKS